LGGMNAKLWVTEKQQMNNTAVNNIRYIFVVFVCVCF
jgi:hypothetical protein